MEKPDLTQVYDALRQAEANGNKEDVAKLIEYIKSVETQPEAKTYDLRDEVPRAIGAGAGAVLGGVVPGVVQSGLNKVQEARNAPVPSASVTVEGAPSSVSAIDEAYGKGVSNAFTQHTREAQTSERQKAVKQILEELKAKGIPVNPNLLADMPGQYARPESGILLPIEKAKEIAAAEHAAKHAPKVLPKDATITEQIAAKLFPNAAQNIGHFLKGVSEYRLPLLGKVGPLTGHLLGGMATGSQAVDAYNRGYVSDDPTGAVISGIGATGTGLSVLPLPPVVRGIGAGVGLSAEAINAYRDAMRRGQIVHGAPENYEQTTPMGDSYAQGGLAYLAAGGQPPKSDANEGGAFIGYPHINKNRKIGSGTGFLDALVGAPPSRENILNPSDYSYMQGYEKGEPYGIAGMMLPFAGAAAKPLAKEVATRAFMGESLTPKMMRGLMPEQPVSSIFRTEKGGNWAPETLTQGWTPEQQLAETLGFYENHPALENWVNTQLMRYVKNDMGTPGDPIRALADQGILHYTPRKAYLEHNNQPSNLQREAEIKRGYAGTPEGESALTQLGKDWESNIDAGTTTRTITPKFIEWNKEEFPWLKNAEGKKLHSIDDEFLYSHLGFDHIVDVLREQIAAGHLRPESMKSLSVPQAVQRVHDYNLAKEKAMQKIKLQADAEMPVHKEYPEGYKWLELKHPTNNDLTEQSLKYEGDAMGHCVGGYCPDVLAGKTKIYSLRDAKGEPHVTVEVQNRADPLLSETSWSSAGDFNWQPSRPIPDEMRAEINAELQKKFGSNREASRWDFLESELRKRLGEPQPMLSIEQIKGKQNLAPKAEYQPFVQDFVRSGNWNQVRDIHNTGLKDMSKTGSNYEVANFPEDLSHIKHVDRYNAVQQAIADKAIPQYATEQEVIDAIRKYTGN